MRNLFLGQILGFGLPLVGPLDLAVLQDLPAKFVMKCKRRGDWALVSGRFLRSHGSHRIKGFQTFARAGFLGLIG